MKWIWTEETKSPCFAEFRLPFSYETGNVTLKISSEYRHIAYINGIFAANGQYPDIPKYKVYDEEDVTNLVKKGENELRVHAFHMGVDCQVAWADVACAAFEIYCDGELIAASSEDTDCRELFGYSVGAKTTCQLGYGFNFDFCATEAEWKKAVVKDTGYNEVPRPVKKTKVEKETDAIVYAQGVFLKNGGETEAAIIQNSWMRTLSFDAMTSKSRKHHYDMHEPLTFKSDSGDGVFVIVDIGKETAGFPTFSLSVNRSCQAYICWGEHLQDLRIRSYVGGRNFAYGFKLKAGENKFTEYFRRIAGRYIGLYVENDEVTLAKLGMVIDEYPIEMPKKDFGDRLLNKIYEVSRHTLQLCIHDHYEDCPWREQALYAGDGRFQMLYGYGAFGEYTMPRESLRMMALCIEDDGMLPLTPPARLHLNIPSASFCWIVALYEYYLETKDIEFVREMLPYAQRIIEGYEKHTANKVINTFTGKKYWNFSEWVDGLNGRSNGTSGRMVCDAPEPDGILTVSGISASANLAELCKILGENEKAEKYTAYSEMLKEGFASFYDEEKELYKSFMDDGDKKRFHVLTNMLAISSGVVTDPDKIAYICEVMKYPEKYGVLETSLVHLALKYEILIKHDKNGLKFAIDQISEVFGGLLFGGATSFWETVYGEMDFEDAGSLCHGWGGLSCYILDKYYAPSLK